MPRLPVLLTFALLLTLLLSACAPGIVGQPDRTGEELPISVAAAVAFFDVNLTVLRATTKDERCLAFGEDLSCSLGNLTPGVATVVVVTGDPGAVVCTLSGFRDKALTLTSYRTFACR